MPPDGTDRTHRHGQEREDGPWHAGHGREYGHHGARQQPSRRRPDQLPSDLAADRRGRRPRFVAPPRNQDRRRDGDQQRWNLRDQRIADRQDRIAFERFVERQSALSHADTDAGRQIDDHDRETGDRVALDESHGAVHRAMHPAFSRQFFTQILRCLRTREARPQIRVDRHLPSRNRIERKAGTDLRHTLRALGDDQKLNDGNDRKDDQADREIVAGHEAAECVDDAACIRVQQN